MHAENEIVRESTLYTRWLDYRNNHRLSVSPERAMPYSAGVRR